MTDTKHTPTNDPAKSGMYAGKKRLFGKHSRFAIAPVHTRFDCVTWLVWDAYERDELTGLAAVVRQEATFEAAVRGLDGLAPSDIAKARGEG